MRLHFQPPYDPAYGVTRARWRKLSGIEKSRLIQDYRDQKNAEVVFGKGSRGNSQLDDDAF